MGPREEFPRISVDKIEDWRRVASTCKQAAVDLLETELGSTALNHEQDALFIHLCQFLDQAFDVAQPNLRVNGHNYEMLDKDGHDTETFDEALDRRIWSLADTRLQWQKRIAENRRHTPIEISNTVGQLLDHQSRLDSDPRVLQDYSNAESPNEVEERLRSGRIMEGVLKMLALVEELDQTINKQRERGERVKSVSTEIKVLRP